MYLMPDVLLDLSHGCNWMMQFSMSDVAPTRFLIRIEDGYRCDNPYHNRIHAADVLRNMHVIATRGRLIRLLGSKHQAMLQERLIQQTAAAERPPGILPSPRKSLDKKAASRSKQLPKHPKGGSSSDKIPSFELRHLLCSSDNDLSSQDCMTLLSVYLAAIIHDYDHRGLTNPFLIQDEDPLAVSEGGRGSLT